jgi:acyl carrier protein
LCFVPQATLTAYARARLESLKVPKRIIALPAIPRGDAGKPQFDKLRAALTTAIHEQTQGKLTTPLDNTFAAVKALAADVFRVDPLSLSSASSPHTVAGWDSFSQIMLVIATEERFGIRIPASRVAGIRSLGELETVIKDIRA